MIISHIIDFLKFGISTRFFLKEIEPMKEKRTLPKTVLVIGKALEPTLHLIRSALEFLGSESDYSIADGRDPSNTGKDSIVLVLNLEGIDRVRLASQLNRANWVILNLEDVETVRLPLEVKEKLSWISTREPRKILGPLVDLFTGTYFDQSENSIVDTVHGLHSEYKAFPRQQSDILPLVATIAIAERLDFSRPILAEWISSLPAASAPSFQYSRNTSEARSHL